MKTLDKIMTLLLIVLFIFMAISVYGDIRNRQKDEAYTFEVPDYPGLVCVVNQSHGTQSMDCLYPETE